MKPFVFGRRVCWAAASAGGVLPALEGEHVNSERGLRVRRCCGMRWLGVVGQPGLAPHNVQQPTACRCCRVQPTRRAQGWAGAKAVLSALTVFRECCCSHWYLEERWPWISPTGCVCCVPRSRCHWRDDLWAMWRLLFLSKSESLLLPCHSAACVFVIYRSAFCPTVGLCASAQCGEGKGPWLCALLSFASLCSAYFDYGLMQVVVAIKLWR